MHVGSITTLVFWYHREVVSLYYAMAIGTGNGGNRNRAYDHYRWNFEGAAYGGNQDPGVTACRDGHAGRARSHP